MFKNVIVRRPGKSLIEGITSAPEWGITYGYFNRGGDDNGSCR
jgi:hypothetical protein